MCEITGAKLAGENNDIIPPGDKAPNTPAA